MKIKDTLKRILGAERLSNIKGIVCHIGCKIRFSFYGSDVLQYDRNKLDLIKELSTKGFHVFRGYYDINYFDKNNQKLLCHRLPINAVDNKQTKCEIGIVDLHTEQFNKIAETSAWCWQQGARLRWNPVDDKQIIFNDIKENGYCAKIYDVESKKCIKQIDWALYDVTPDMQYGISLNYSRLQRLRPGYGYNYYEDETVEKKAPDNDGIYLIDLNKNEARLLYSLEMLANKVDIDKEYVHYVNHVSIAPDGKQFLFFHIYIDPNKSGWKTILYISDLMGKKLVTLEQEDRVSHYCWIDSENLMITCRKENGIEYYCRFNILSKQKQIVNVEGLDMDGHPAYICSSDLFLTDTYPKNNGLQRIKVFSLEKQNAVELASIYHDYRLRGEKRCDLHPSLSIEGSYITIDTTYKKGKRCILIFGMKEGAKPSVVWM